jgi:hypothetical protein
MFTKIDPRNLERISGGIISGGCVGPFPRPQPEPVLPTGTGTGPTFPQLPLPGGSQPIR